MKRAIWFSALLIASLTATASLINSNLIGDIHAMFKLEKEQSKNHDVISKEYFEFENSNPAQEAHSSKWKVDLQAQKVFISNHGQFKADPSLNIDKEIRYAYDGNTEDVFFTSNKIVLELVKKSLPEKTDEFMAKRAERKKQGFKDREEVMQFRNESKKITFDKDILVSEWIGADPNAELIATEETAFKHTYMFFNAEKKEDVANLVSSYKKLTYKNLYPFIDVVYEIHPETGYKYSIIVHPGGDLTKVKLRYSKDITLGMDGKIRTASKFGEIIDHAPVTFYDGETSSIINSSYVVDGRDITFNVANHDATKTLIIDPWTQSPSFPTNWDCVWECETDAAGNSYLIGGVMPLTLQKYNSAGVLQWSFNTPYDSTAWLGGFATDDAGNSFVTNGSAARILKVNNAGALQWSNNNPGGIFTLTEFWNIAFNCDQTKLVIAGTSGSLNPVPCVYNIDVTDGDVIQAQDVTGPGALFGIPPNTNEVRAITATANNKYYFLTHDSIGYVSDDLSLCPGQSEPFHVENGNYNMSYKCENWRYDNSGIEALAYYDGFVFVNRGNRLDKRDFNTAAILQSVTIPGGGWTASLGQNQTQNSGIAIDQCGNIYVGSKTGVYRFNQALTQTGFFATTFNVYDVEITSTGEIIAGGSTGTSSNSSRTGTLQSFAASACAQPVTVCCNPSICAVPPVCSTDAPFTIPAETAGGTWSASPATPALNTSTGQFNPALASPGTYTITYTLACGSESTSIVVNNCVAITACLETNNSVTATGGSGTLTWSTQSTTTTSTPITTEAQCIACPTTTPNYVFGFYTGCSGTTCTQTITTWNAFGTGTNQTPPSYPVQIQDANGTILVINSAASLTACSSVPCPTINFTTPAQTNVSCFGGNNGSATVSASGGTGPYTYTWSPGNLSGATQSNLTAGTYTVNVTDNNNCPGSTTVTITQPVSAVSVASTAQTNVLCFGQSTGSATVAASGGTGPYTYTWTPGNLNGATQSNLTAGTYTINVTDNNNCPGSTTVTITQPASALNASASATAATCGSNNGSATVSATGGTGSYTYSWSPGGAATASISNLSSGSYTVTVTDANGCTTTASANVGSAGGPTITVNSFNDVTCNGLTDGSATVSGSGGTGTLSYSWSPGNLTGTTQNNLAAGTYTVTVTDQGGCSNSTTVTISQPTAISLTSGVITPANCGANDGSAAVIASGGTGSLTYAWNPNVSTSSSATNIGAGTYTVTVSDANNCSQTINLVVSSIGGPTVTLGSSANVSCFGENDGSATVVANGGTAPYTYAWSPNGGSNATANGLTAGNYQVVVSDDQGCIGTLDVVISSPNQLVVTGTITNPNCGSMDGSISAVASGGNGGYTYSWAPGGQTGSSISNLGAGSYTVNVTDSEGCTTSESFVLTLTGSITIDVQPENVTINQGESVQLFASGADTYTWSPASGLSCTDCSSPFASPSTTTVYTVTGTDASGCTGVAAVTVFVTQVCGDLFVPTVFSPNDKGPSINNTLCVMGGCIAELTYAVYNRWGEKIFETTDPEQCWDGMYKDKPVNSGVYAYKLYAVLFDGTVIEESGNLTIVR
jgi:gliding motility-associated-like protein